jgi:hypothetical protein
MLFLAQPYHTESRAAPIAHWMGPNAFTALSMHRSRNVVAAASSAAIKLYDLDRQSADPEEIRWPTASDTITDVYVGSAVYNGRNTSGQEDSGTSSKLTKENNPPDRSTLSRRLF